MFVIIVNLDRYGPGAITGGPEARLTFHSTQELPLLRQWYATNNNPSRTDLETYVDILNSVNH